MAIAVKNNTVYAVEEEVTEGTYVAPSADTSFVQAMSDGAELNPAKETVERSVFNGSIGKSTPRTSLRSVSGAIPVEMKSAGSAAPEFDKLLRSALGLKRTVTSTTIDATDSGGTHTTTRAYLPDADAGKYSVGDIVTVEKVGAYHTSPISAKSDTGGDVYIDFLIPAGAAFIDSEVIKATNTYLTADSGHPSLSISKYIEEARLEQGTGCKVTSMAMENFTTGQLASYNFGFEGLNFDASLTAQPFTPDFEDSLPPIILNACVYQDSTQLPVNEIGWSLENSLGFVTSTCSANGRISSRPTERSVSGSFNPYKHDDSVAQWDNFTNDTQFSVFGFAYLPSTTAGEYTNVVSFYMPNCNITEIAEADQDGNLQNDISFSASRGADGSEEEIYLGFS